MPKIHFITFGGPTSNYHDAVNRLCSQAKKFELFDNITGYTENDLLNDTDFWMKHKQFISSHSRGFGYWIWKPYLIYKKLMEIDEGDILLYLDSGCELNPQGKPRFLELVEKTINKLIIGTTSSSDDVYYTKMDLVKYMQMESHSSLKKNHMQACALMMLNCSEIKNLFNEYYDLCNNYNLIDDSPSIINNHNGFIEHRHDQSVFNLLVKKYNLINYDMDPTDWGYGYTSKQSYINHGLNFPIWTCRNRSGKSMT
jgi:hypothetical protein